MYNLNDASWSREACVEPQMIKRLKCMALYQICDSGKLLSPFFASQHWTHPPIVPHICVSESGQHGFGQWRVAYSPPSHHLNQCWFIVNRNKYQWIFNQYAKLFVHKNLHENIVCEMGAILSRDGGRWVKWVTGWRMLFILLPVVGEGNWLEYRNTFSLCNDMSIVRYSVNNRDNHFRPATICL